MTERGEILRFCFSPAVAALLGDMIAISRGIFKPHFSIELEPFDGFADCNNNCPIEYIFGQLNSDRRFDVMSQHYVYSFYAELRDHKPKIWRRFEINGEKTMAELGYAIMLMFEMQASHLFCFRENSKENFLAYLRTVYPDEEKFNSYVEKISMDEFLNNVRYELPSEDMFTPDDERLIEADKIKLGNVTHCPGWKASFEYDYGDGWEIDLTLEKCEKQEISLAILPRVLKGEGFGIVEDVGGVGGLENLAKVLKKGKGKEYKETCEWLDSDSLDLEAFDIDDMNFRLKKLIRVYRESYECRYDPTEKSLSLLLREYKGKGARGY